MSDITMRNMTLAVGQTLGTNYTIMRDITMSLCWGI